jgi:hypothetical protein
MMSVGSLLGLMACNDFALEKVKDTPVDGERVLEADPELLDFGALASNEPVTDIVTLTATGALPVTLSEIALTGSSAFAVTWPEGVEVIEPEDTLDLVVTYTPASFDDEARILVTSDAVEPSLVVPLLGAGLYPAIAVDPPSVGFVSEFGESVDVDVTVSSVGTADLAISDLYVEGEWFGARSSVPVTLPPGDTTTVTVTYTPVVPGESVSGKLWLTTNTAAGYAVVPLEAVYGKPCVGLGEAWDRGFLEVETLWDGLTLHVTNLSEDEEICVDSWYVYLSDTSQDLGAGDMSADFGDAYPEGSIDIAPGDTVSFYPSEASGPSWWCMEQTQYTDRGQPYVFTGAYVPEPLLSAMYAEDQDGVWAWMADNPVMIAARDTNYLEVSGAGGEGSVAVRVINMGGRAGEAELRESVPAGWVASDFSVPPDRTETGEDGAAVYVWDVALDAREETALDTQTIYDEASFSYRVSLPACRGRQYAPLLTSSWIDASGSERVASANPLVVNCVDEP